MEKIVENLRSSLKTDFQKQVLDAAMQSVDARDNPLRLNNFCTNFRELIRDVLGYLAPDDHIIRCSWYQPDPTSQTGITRGHRVSYVIHGGIADIFAEDVLGIDVVGERKQLTQIVSVLSSFTHVTEGTINTPEADVDRHVLGACEALLGLLSTAEMARDRLVHALQERIETEVIRSVITETIGSVDELATHHTIDGVDIERVDVLQVDAEEVLIVAHGYLQVQLQWGSNSDVRNDMGAIMAESFPLSMHFTSSVAEPLDVEPVEDSLLVDTSSWYGGQEYDEEHGF